MSATTHPSHSLPLCADCHHMRIHPRHNRGGPTCGHAAFSPDLVTGDPVRNCELERNTDNGSCGVAGALFEPRNADTISRAAVVALRNRAKQLALTQAALGKADGLRFAQGALSELSALLDSNGPALAAGLDESNGGYQPHAGFEAAWAAFPERAKHLTLAEMQEFLRAQGAKVATDAVSYGNVNAVVEVKHREGAKLNLHNEQPAFGVDVHDGASVHGDSPKVACIVAQGGAA